MKKIYVHGGDIITSLGNLEKTWDQLQTACVPKTYLPKDHLLPIPLAYISELEEEFGSAKRLKELLNRLYSTLPVLPAETSLFCATTKGAVDELLIDHSPASGQVWQIAEEVKNALNLQNEARCVSAACASGTIAVMQGAMSIAAGRSEYALIVGVDIISNFVINGFTSLKALSQKGCRPFDQKRDGLTLGEGAGWLLLSGKPPETLPTKCSHQLSSWGMSCDATHITAPCRYGSGLIRTLQQTMSGRLTPPGGINAHGTGTYYNDAMELLAFNTLWQTPPPITSVKGAIGHCLGAAGVIESCLCLKSLDTMCLPPTTGLANPEENAADITSGSKSLQLQNPSILSCNSGFGGINAALLFEKESESAR